MGVKGEPATFPGNYSVASTWIMGVDGCLVLLIAGKENERYAHFWQTSDGRTGQRIGHVHRRHIRAK